MQNGYIHAFQFPDGRTIHLYQGSLAEVRADALVSSDDNRLSAGGGVSAALARVAGPEVAIERERVVREARPTLGDVVRTSGGGLPCRYLYHAITIDFNQRAFQSEDSLRRLVAKLLDLSTADGVSSLGIPALGTGAAAFNLDRASEVIIEELVARMRQSSVQRVILALLGNEAERRFHENLVRAVGMRQAAEELREMDERREPSNDQTRILKRSIDRHASESNHDPHTKLVRRPHVFHAKSIKEDDGPTSDQSVIIRIWRFLQSMVSADRTESVEDQPPPPMPVCGPVPCLSVAEHPKNESSQSCSARTPKLSRIDASEVESFDGETVEQVASRFDERRLRRIDGERPRLVSGLTDIILRHTSAEEIEQELLSLPECHGFRGNLRQRLMEFLYLSEEKLRLALGPALFRTKDLRVLAGELGLHDVAHLEHPALVTEILRNLGFNMVAPPRGSNESIQRVERLLGALRSTHPDEMALRSAVIEAGRILEGFLFDLLKLYSGLFWGDRADEELVARGLISKRREGAAIHHLSLGQLREVMARLSGLIRRDESMKQRWSAAGRPGQVIFHRGNDAAGGRDGLDGLSDLIAARNDAAHNRTPGDGQAQELTQACKNALPAHAKERRWTLAGVVSLLEALLDFCQMSRREGVYPEVLRYEGTFENRHGERFLHFLDESQHLRKVRSDEPIDPRRHYFCFATNNPVHLFPVLIPKD